MYAVVRSGSKQQKVAVGDVIEIDAMGAAVDDHHHGKGEGVAGRTKGPQIVIQKYKNKTGYKKRQGHRQKYTQVKVTDISL